MISLVTTILVSLLWKKDGHGADDNYYYIESALFRNFRHSSKDHKPRRRSLYSCGKFRGKASKPMLNACWTRLASVYLSCILPCVTREPNHPIIPFGQGLSGVSKVLSRALRPMGRRWSPFHSPRPDTSRSRKTKYTLRIFGKTTDTGYARLLPSFRWNSLTDPGGMACWVGGVYHNDHKIIT